MTGAQQARVRMINATTSHALGAAIPDALRKRAINVE